MGNARFLSSWEYRIGLVLISLFVLWVYVPGLENGFAVGDIMNRMPEIAFPDFLEQVLMSSRSQAAYWLFNWVLSRIFVDNSMGYRLVLFILHIIAGLVLSDLAGRMTGDRRVGLAAFLIFALYPRNHQVLMWSVSNNKVLGTLLLLACVDFALQYRQENRSWQGVLAVIFAILALLTSGGNNVLFILLPMVWVLFRREETFYFNARTRNAALVLAALGVGLALITIDWGGRFELVHGDSVPISGLRDAYQILPLSLATLKDFFVYNTYLLLPFIPLRSLDPSILTSLLATVCFFFLIAAFGVGVKLPRLAVVWMVAGILPYVLFVPYGNADRYFYLAAAGYALLVGRMVMRVYDLTHQQGRMGTLELVVLSLLGVYVVAGTVTLRARLDEWQIAGNIASRVVQQTLSKYPEPERGHLMLFVNLPTSYGQAYIDLCGCISGEIAHVYQEEKGVAVKAYQVRDPDVIEYVEGLPVQVVGDEDEFTIFLYENGHLIEKDSTMAEMDFLKPTLWIN